MLVYIFYDSAWLLYSFYYYCIQERKFSVRKVCDTYPIIFHVSEYIPSIYFAILTEIYILEFA